MEGGIVVALTNEVSFGVIIHAIIILFVIVWAVFHLSGKIDTIISLFASVIRGLPQEFTRPKKDQGKEKK
jgi:small neutral amino acid transporter SnatA (MarC family)